MSQKLKETILMTASYYSVILRPEVLIMYAEDLNDLPVDLVIEAYKTYRRDQKNRSMPLPAHIRAIVAPSPTPESEARELVERIKEAISKFGWSSDGKAREFVGPVGWKLVQRMGGWMSLCESDFITNHGAIAQARAVALDQIIYGQKWASRVQQQIQHKEYVQIEEPIIELSDQEKNKLDKFIDRFGLNREKLGI